MSDFLQVLHERTSAEHFDSAAPILDVEIRELVGEATQAPSTFNMQHWRFIAITDSDKKQQLAAATIESNQERMKAAPVVFLILGDLEAHQGLKAILDDSVDSGLFQRAVADVWLAMASGMYGSDPRAARDEAIRSGSLAGMALMLAAGNRGYASCPIGFNPVPVKAALDISDRYVPVMMLALGRPAPGNTARRPRLGVDQVLAFNASREF